MKQHSEATHLKEEKSGALLQFAKSPSRLDRLATSCCISGASSGSAIGKKYFALWDVKTLVLHPLFRIVDGDVEGWEKL
jgi:hypothetical protein